MIPFKYKTIHVSPSVNAKYVIRYLLPCFRIIFKSNLNGYTTTDNIDVIGLLLLQILDIHMDILGSYNTCNR